MKDILLYKTQIEKRYLGKKIEFGEFEFFVGIGKLLKSVGHLQKNNYN